MRSERTILLFGFITFFLLWFLGSIKPILGPFVLAGIFAFLLDPLITFSEQKLHLSRVLAIFIVYVIFLGSFIFLGTVITQQIVHESNQLKNAVTNIDTVTKSKIVSLPHWLQPTVKEALVSLERSKYFSASSFISIFPKIATSAFSILIFLFSGFYLLKDGGAMFTSSLEFFPQKKRKEIATLLIKINDVFGQFLRGQIILVIFVAVILFIGLTFLGVRYALLLAIFSGFAELIPIIGPLVAGAIAVIIGLLYGSHMVTDPTRLVIFVTLLYFILRQLQDYLVTPYVLGRVTKLHPLLVLFAVVVGGHLYGVLGLVLAVPVAAMLKIIVMHFFNQPSSHEEKVS